MEAPRTHVTGDQGRDTPLQQQQVHLSYRWTNFADAEKHVNVGVVEGQSPDLALAGLQCADDT